MPLAEFATPEITQEYLHRLNNDRLIELLQHKTKGLLVASRIKLSDTSEAKTLAEEVKKIQQEIEHRRSDN